MRRYMKIIILLLITFSILGTIYWPQNIDNTYECIEFEIGSGVENFESVSVHIKGKSYRSLFRDDHVKIKIYFDDEVYPNTEQYPYIFPWDHGKGREELITYDGEIVFEPTNRIGNNIKRVDKFSYVDLSFKYWSENRIQWESLGRLYMTPDHGNIFMSLYKKTSNTSYSWAPTEGYKMIVSENSIPDAIKLINEITIWNIED